MGAVAPVAPIAALPSDDQQGIKVFITMCLYYYSQVLNIIQTKLCMVS